MSAISKGIKRTWDIEILKSENKMHQSIRYFLQEQLN